MAQRTWQSGSVASSGDAVHAALAAAGYTESSVVVPGTYNVWSDVDPRHGSSSCDFYVVEDPARPVIDQLVARFGGSIKSEP